MTPPADTAALPCGHPAAATTCADNPPHDGSTWTCAWCAEVGTAQARAERLATLVRDFAHSCACPEGVRPCRPFMHNDRACETIAAALLQDDTAALDAAIRRARADAYRRAAEVADHAHADHGEESARVIAQRLRRLADDAEAGA